MGRPKLKSDAQPKAFADGEMDPRKINDLDVSEAPVTFLADAFNGGVPLRPAFDAVSARYGSAAWATEKSQRMLIDATLGYGDTLSRKIENFSFGATRSNRFIRLLLDKLDDCGTALDETLVTRAAAMYSQVPSQPFMTMQSHETQSDSLRWIALHVPPREKNHRVLLRVSDAFSELSMRVWDAGLCMYAHIVDPNSPIHADVSHARVLELGSGTGVCAYALKSACANHVLMTDLQHALDNLRVNVTTNCADDVVSVQSLDFTDPQAVVDVVSNGRFQTILAADVSYDETLVRALAHTLQSVFLDGVVCTAYVFATKRNPKTYELLLTLLNHCPFSLEFVNIVPDSTGVFDYLVQFNFSSVSVLRLRPKR